MPKIEKRFRRANISATLSLEGMGKFFFRHFSKIASASTVNLLKEKSQGS